MATISVACPSHVLFSVGEKIGRGELVELRILNSLASKILLQPLLDSDLAPTESSRITAVIRCRSPGATSAA